LPLDGLHGAQQALLLLLLLLVSVAMKAGENIYKKNIFNKTALRLDSPKG
jgi:hypothetical protein